MCFAALLLAVALCSTSPITSPMNSSTVSSAANGCALLLLLYLNAYACDASPPWHPYSQDDAAGDGEVGEDAWRAALLRARGEKVLDDPRLLRRSAKREAKAKAKRKQTWQQRVKQQADEQASRQQRCVWWGLLNLVMYGNH